MRLKSLKLAGFKSFANPTTFTFRHGITAIVGPNGCGKSNVIDAIRWVLGESSAKQLRGGAMSDVIFAGTQNKAAKSLASVELTFEHTQDEHTGIRHELNLYHELSVRRQVNVEGKSDYFINGTRCRRRDVVDVFLGTGLGPRSYSVIQQGMIGRIVDSSPLQLREYIEEAAGVSRYQARREETQKKLLKTRENLERLNDIEAELTRQKKKLVKQAESATQYQNLKEQLSHIKEQLATHQLYQAKNAQMQHKSQQESLNQTVNNLQSELNTIKRKLSSVQDRLAEEQWLKDEARDKLHVQDIQKQQLTHKLETLQSNLDQLDHRYNSNLENQRLNKKNFQEIEKLNKTQTEKLQALTPKLKELEQKQQQTQEKHAPLQQAWEASQADLVELEAQKTQLAQTIALDKQALLRQQNDLEKSQHKQSQWKADAMHWGLIAPDDSQSLSIQPETTHPETIRQDLMSELHDAVKKADAELNSLFNQKETIEDRIDIEKPVLNQLRQGVEDKQSQLVQLEKQHASLIAEYETLHAIVHPTKSKNLSNAETTNLNAGQASDLQDTQNAYNTKKANTEYAAGQSSGSNAPKYGSISTGFIENLPELHQKIKLSKLGEKHADILDMWLGFWLDSRIFEDKDKDKNQKTLSSDKTTDLKQAKFASWQQLMAGILTSGALNTRDVNSDGSTDSHNQSNNKDKNPANSIFLTDAASVDSSISSSNSSLKNSKVLEKIGIQLEPLNRLIASPNLKIFQHCYLCIDNKTEHTDADVVSLNARLSDENDKANNPEHLESLVNALAQLPMGSVILTSGGWLISRLGALHISKLTNGSQSAQFLSLRVQQQQRLTELEDTLNQVEAELETLGKSLKNDKAQYEQATIYAEELAEQLTSIDHQAADIKQKRVELIAQRDRQQHEQRRLKQQRDELNSEHQDITAEIERLQLKISADEQKLEALLPKLSAAKESQHELEQQRITISQLEREENEVLRKLQIEFSQVQGSQEHSQQQLAQLKAESKSLADHLQKINDEIENATEKLPELEKQLKSANAEYHELKTDLDERNAIISNLQNESNQIQKNREEKELQFHQTQEKLAQTSTQLALANERINEASEHLKRINNSISPKALIADFIAHGRTLTDEKLQTLHREETELNSKLEKIGPVNLAAAVELEAVDERLLPLEQQIVDITESMDTLTDAISSIDSKTKTLFLKTLDSVNESLTHLFTKVFGGGQASLTLIKDAELAANDQWRAGLELMAQPKGKKNSRLAVLSGGEKTLTALSLIFAIFKQHPAPFCVLDEVDAPLDDSNVSRFTNLINELADDVQFIFISHNKLAMQIADELKGVTMPQAGISTLVSVSLEEAEHYLDANA